VGAQGIQAMPIIMDALVNILGAFVGFLLAMIFQKATEKKQAKQVFQKILRSLHDELKEMYEMAYECAQNETLMEKDFLVPAWTAVISSSVILEIIDQFELYKKIIAAYSVYDRFNKNYGLVDWSYSLKLQDSVISYSAEAANAILPYIEEKK